MLSGLETVLSVGVGHEGRATWPADCWLHADDPGILTLGGGSQEVPGACVPHAEGL